MIVIALLLPVVSLLMLFGLPALEDHLFPPPPPLPEQAKTEPGRQRTNLGWPEAVRGVGVDARTDAITRRDGS
ncbi:hypothetical protein ABZ915_44050 [Streptomyces sp. NPDC046915]|uniref:hypothetical protein n=1 Tax=Streptomyces sp. NPDC046915 TaxID=3155257 RepID=UPI003403686F